MNTLMLTTKLKQQTRHGQTPPRRTTPLQTATVSPITVPGRVTDTVTDQVQQLAQSLANQMVAEMQQSQIISRNMVVLILNLMLLMILYQIKPKL